MFKAYGNYILTFEYNNLYIILETLISLITYFCCMRRNIKFKIEDPALFIEKLAAWGRRHDKFCLLNSNNYKNITSSPYTYHEYECLAGAGEISSLNVTQNNSFEELRKFTGEQRDWMFGYFSYDLKNETENLSSSHPDGIGFPKTDLFIPRHLFLLKGGLLKISYLPGKDNTESIKEIFEEIDRIDPGKTEVSVSSSIKAVFSESRYLETVEKLLEHIKGGDIYEVNFCQEFYADAIDIDPFSTYILLNRISPTPFSCFYRQGERYLLCASPERFLKKKGKKIISQPVKGTYRRGKTAEEDRELAAALKKDPKERSENIMITDLVRNDLSRTASKGSIKVQELCGIYTFPQVHQMISTVTSEMKPGLHFTEVIKSAFPMGSMTGAPKIRAMELIEKYERSKRGLYSGSVGYITPEGDFDFNVVIRSIQYNKYKRYLSFMTGGAITALSVPEKEYSECLLKASAMMKVLNATGIDQKS